MLEELLVREKAAILKKWLQVVLETYPEESARFLEAQKDPFANPAGAAIRAALAALFEDLLRPAARASDQSVSLADLMRLRSVQGFPPSRAVGFVPALKRIIREVVGSQVDEDPLRAERQALEARIDLMALTAFDLFARCREELYELRVREALGQRDAAVRLLEWSGRRSRRSAGPGAAGPQRPGSEGET
jgi:hypothetical protein